MVAKLAQYIEGNGDAMLIISEEAAQISKVAIFAKHAR